MALSCEIDKLAGDNFCLHLLGVAVWVWGTVMVAPRLWSHGWDFAEARLMRFSGSVLRSCSINLLPRWLILCIAGQLIFWSAIFAQMSRSLLSSRRGGSEVSLKWVLAPTQIPCRITSLHWKDNHTHAPAIDEARVSALPLRDNLRRNKYKCAAKGLHNAKSVIEMTWKCFAGIRTRRAVASCTTLARPKSATLTIGGTSLVRRMFSGFKSRCVIPRSWTYYQIEVKKSMLWYCDWTR